VGQTWVARAVRLGLLVAVVLLAVVSGTGTGPAAAPKPARTAPASVVTPYLASAFGVANFTGNIGVADEVVARHLSGSGTLLDLAVRQQSYGNIYFYRNTSSAGAISFATPLVVNVNAGGLTCMAFGDVDGDGKIDFVASDSNGTNIYVGLNTSVGAAISYTVSSFAAPYNGKTCTQIALGDLYGNGKMDIAEIVHGYYDPAVTTVFIPNTTVSAGSPTFNSAGFEHFNYSYPEQGGSQDVTGLAIAPFAGAGNGNYAVMSQEGGFSGGTGFMHFYHAVAGVMTDALDIHPGNAYLASGLTVGNVFGSAVPYDIVLPWYSQGSPHVLRNTSTGGVLSFAAATTISGIGSQSSSGRAAVGNFAGTTGAQDILFVTTGGFQVWLNNGSGTFSQATGSPFGSEGSGAAAAIADLDGDGYADWAGSVSVNYNLHVDYGHAQGAATFSPTTANAGNLAVRNTSAQINETISNTGLAPLTGMSFGSPSSSDWTGGFGLTAGNCQGVTSLVAVHSPASASPTSCTFFVTFTPTTIPGATETSTAPVSINSLATIATLPLTGNGVSPTASPATRTFPNTIVNPATSSYQSVTFTVPTLSPAMAGTFAFGNVPSYAITGPNAADFAVTTDGCRNQTLSVAGNSCTLQLTFTPQGTGSRAGTLTLSDSAGSIQVVPLSGTGIGPATHFTVTTATPAAAGAAQDLTVTALDVNNNVALGYRGIAHLTSNDPHPATLPTDYTFTSADSGIHVFSGGVVLFTATSAASLTATDTVTASITGSQTGITVTPGVATTLTAAYASPSSAGIANDFSITAKDAYGNTATGYRGTVRVTSSDARAVLPPDYTFLSADQGFVALPVALKTAGIQSLTATDTATASLTATRSGITVTPAAAATLVLAIPVSSTEGAAFSGSVTARDSFGNVATAYTGTVGFTGPSGATLPAPYTFTSGSGLDNGVHTFSNAFAAAEEGDAQGFAATDTVTASITGSATTTTLDAPLSVTPTNFSGTEGSTLTNVVVATFTDGDPNGVAGDYTATIAWGDGTSASAGTVSLGTGNFVVTGSHTYAEESPAGGWKVKATIVEGGGAIGVTWTQKLPVASPRARDAAVMAFDPATGNTLLFGGIDGSTILGDTWIWDGSNWTQRSPATSPPARYHAALAYDAAHGLLVLFGGADSSRNALADTWTWDGTTWTQM